MRGETTFAHEIAPHRNARQSAGAMAGELRGRAAAAPGCARTIELVEIQTAGDQVRDVPLPLLGGEGLFTKEIQRALLAGNVDVAVHSLKDLPTLPVSGLVLAAVPPRGPTGDVFVSRRHRSFETLPPGAVVATSSLRRQAQLLHRRPDLHVVSIRGNVETRLRKLDGAGAGCPDPGPGRAGTAGTGRGHHRGARSRVDAAGGRPGALGLECRADDRVTLDLLGQVNDRPTAQAVRAERALLRALGGGCQVPIGAASAVAEETLRLRAVVLRPDGTRRIEGHLAGTLAEAEAVGRRLAEDLLNRGRANCCRGTGRRECTAPSAACELSSLPLAA